jgi:type IV pilus assembly protein PilC
MPYYKWSGIDITGCMHKGRLFARSKEELDALLFKQEIALLTCSPVRQIWLQKKVSLDLKIQFFKTLAEMLGSGVLVPEALLIVSSQTPHAFFQEIIANIAQDVHEGASLSQALAKYPHIFDSMMVNMINVGEESGRLAISLTLLSDYLATVQDFKKRLWASMLVPLCTFIFFCFVALIIFIWVIPHFTHMFDTAKQQLPTSTKIIISLSNFLNSQLSLLFLGLFILVIFIAWRSSKSVTGKLYIDACMLKLPWIGTIIQESNLAYYLHAIAMLLHGGIQLRPALSIAKQTVNNSIIRKQLDIIEHEVDAGNSLSQAMIYEPDQIFSAEIIAAVRAGEESGRLVSVLNRSAHLYQEKVKRSISLVTMLINPLLMLILGLLIAFLIFAIYMPIFNLSQVVG